ncbi:hypothetical protein [Halodesulfovibrio aestuarii]|uniref:Uncharacterized protein n=1 Tax=Halodesulfovibrio aestuarii TaxID=126333 RepID=A0ABV4JQN4_9BACT
MLTDGKIRQLIAKGKIVFISDDNRGKGEGRLYLKVAPKKNGVTADWYFQWFDQTQKKRRMKIGVVTSATVLLQYHQ